MSGELGIFLLLLGCFAGSAFFAGVESGMLTVNHARLMHLVRSGSRSAAILNACIQDMQRFLTTILVGNNLTNVMLSTLSASLARHLLPSHHLLQTVWAVLMAFMVLFFSEYLPKLFFTTRPLRRTLLVARVFRVAERLLAPLAALVRLMTTWVIPKGRNASGQRFLMTREYIQNVVSDARDGSRITAVERLMINRVLTLHALSANQVMTPLSRVSKTTEKATLRDCYRLMADSGHVRMPVFARDGDRCLGVLNVLDVLASPSADPDRTFARDWMRPTVFVPAEMRADDLLPLMRKRRQPMIMVSGKEEGDVLGIITEENILTVLTGNLDGVARN